MRFERAILMLQAHAARNGWQDATHGLWPHSIHFVVAVPDGPDPQLSIARFLDSGLASLLASAGLPGWTFPEGCTSPEIAFSIERSLDFNRK
jgi:hypothetical protein